MGNKNIDKLIAVTLLICGAVSNGFAIPIIMQRGFNLDLLTLINFIANVASWTFIVLSGAIMLKLKKYYAYSCLVVLVTAFISFPAMLFTSRDAVFLTYWIILGSAFGLVGYKNVILSVAGIFPLFLAMVILIVKVHFHINMPSDYMERNLMFILGGISSSYVFTLFSVTFATQALMNINNKLENQACIDPLTGCKNRCALSKDNLKDSGLLMIDIDFFKRINDEFGHLNGDESLRFLVKTVKDCIRYGDLIIRYGGEEFIIVLKGMNNFNKLKVIAEDIRVKVLTLSRVEDSIKAPFTISIGGCFWKDGVSLEDNIKTLDSYLYAAKHAGRNTTYIQE